MEVTSNKADRSELEGINESEYGAVHSSKKYLLGKTTKHIDIKQHYVRGNVDKKSIKKVCLSRTHKAYIHIKNTQTKH
jgi:hypothetical protein